jgi:hypothetical protein
VSQKVNEFKDVPKKIVLTMAEEALRESPHITAQATTVFGYSGVGEEFAEAQASVTIPPYKEDGGRC